MREQQSAETAERPRCWHDCPCEGYCVHVPECTVPEHRHALDETGRALQPSEYDKARVDQTILAGDPKRQGNCVSACVATYLGVPIETVPHFVEYDGATVDGTAGGTGWWWLMIGFMAGKRGLWPVELDDVDEGRPGELLFVAGMSERGVLHQVLYRDGVLWHDPHPSKAGLLDVREVLAWRPTTHDHTPSDNPTPPGHPTSPEAAS